VPTSYEKRLSARPGCEARIELPTSTKLNSYPQYTVAAPRGPPDPHPHLSFVSFCLCPLPLSRRPLSLPPAEQRNGRRRAPIWSASRPPPLPLATRSSQAAASSRAHPFPPAALTSGPPPLPIAKGSRRSPGGLASPCIWRRVEAWPRPPPSGARRPALGRIWPGLGLLLARPGGARGSARRRVDAAHGGGVWRPRWAARGGGSPRRRRRLAGRRAAGTPLLFSSFFCT
jgi:hypothetical protein